MIYCNISNHYILIKSETLYIHTFDLLVSIYGIDSIENISLIKVIKTHQI